MATIIFDTPDGTRERDVDDEDLNYREDHWQVTLGDDDYLYIPLDRVYSVRMHDPHHLHD
ncbi:hypothetical protein [Halorarius litoreus]|uniref:hypothetical protein n=1 Tax=Halorarius litoreus TaxID=2962676 RepID=UPI0020CDA0F3|nr:hypothetical protein [Halorarius litoreus]